MATKWTAEHTSHGLIIRDDKGKFIAMSYAPTTEEEKANLEIILNAPVMAEQMDKLGRKNGKSRMINMIASRVLQ